MAGHEAPGAKDLAMAGSASAQVRMKTERRASLETGNVTAEPVRNRRRPPSDWEASSKSTKQKHRGIGAGMWAKEESVNTGSPRWRGERSQSEAREGQAGPARVAERFVVTPLKGGNYSPRTSGTPSGMALFQHPHILREPFLHWEVYVLGVSWHDAYERSETC